MVYIVDKWNQFTVPWENGELAAKTVINTDKNA
jgi:hypothetical protein